MRDDDPGQSETLRGGLSFTHFSPPSPHSSPSDLDRFLSPTPRPQPRSASRISTYAQGIAASLAASIKQARNARGGQLYAATIQAPKRDSDGVRLGIVVRFVGAIADAGGDVVGALESHDGQRHRRRLHAHVVVRSDLSREAVHALALAAGGRRCSIRPITDLDGWCRYLAKNIRATNVHEVVLVAGSVRLSEGRRVRARPLAPPKPKKPQSGSQIDRRCVVCRAPLRGRADQATCSRRCRVQLHRARGRAAE